MLQAPGESCRGLQSARRRAPRSRRHPFLEGWASPSLGAWPQRLARPSTLWEDEMLPRGPKSRINPICCCRLQVKAAEGCCLRGDARLGLGAIPFWRAGLHHHLVLEPQRLARPSTLCEDEVLPRGPQSRINPICCFRFQVKAAEGCSLRGDARLGLGAIPF